MGGNSFPNTEGTTGEEIAAELGVSAATLYDWRRAYGGMDAYVPQLEQRSQSLSNLPGRS